MCGSLFWSIWGLRPQTPYTLARGAPLPHSARVAHSLSLVRSSEWSIWGRSSPDPVHARSRGPLAPLRSRGSLAVARSLERDCGSSIGSPRAERQESVPPENHWYNGSCRSLTPLLTDVIRASIHRASILHSDFSVRV